MCRSPLLPDLPLEIIINILSGLPVRTILSCKCVCKKLRQLLSTPEFVASHLALSAPGLVIHQYGVNRDLWEIFEFEDGFELQHNNHNPIMTIDPVSMGLSDSDLRIVGSVNGLLCLRDCKSELYDALYICNPIMREYIALPRIESTTKYLHVQYGFGVSKISGQYKVVRNVHRHSDDHEASSCSDILNYECLVYAVGTRSWRNIQPGAPLGHFDLSSSSFLNGNLHGSVQDCSGLGNMLISCFNLEAESFQPFPPPPPAPVPPTLGTLGVLDDCLCFVDNSYEDDDIIDIWVMKEYGVEKSWTKQLVIVEVEAFVPSYYDPVYPIKAFQNGDILLNFSDYNLFYFDNKTKTCQNLDLVIQNKDGFIEAVPHSSSFLSLKRFEGENVIIF